MDKFRKYRNKEIAFVIAPFNYGGEKNGAQYGPIQLLEYYKKDSNISFFKVADIEEQKATLDLKLKNKSNVIESCKKVYSLVYDAFKEKCFPVILGGDHSISSGSVEATIENFEDVGVIWIDAHADFNDETTTPTGNMHGMPLSSLCGFGPDCMINYSRNSKKLDPKKIVIISGRDFDAGEIEKIKTNEIKCFMMEDVRKNGIENVVNETINYLSSNAKNIHISFDIDAISPEYAPGTGTPVENGMNILDAKKMLNKLLNVLNVVSIDFVEFNPLIDENNKTFDLMTSLIDLVIKKQ